MVIAGSHDPIDSAKDSCACFTGGFAVFVPERARITLGAASMEQPDHGTAARALQTIRGRRV